MVVEAASLALALFAAWLGARPATPERSFGLRRAEHVWTITSGFPTVSAHVLVASDADCHEKRPELERVLAARFGLTHTILQVDHAQEGAPIELGTAERRSTPL